MTKRYYLDENGFIVGEVPLGLITPAVIKSSKAPESSEEINLPTTFYPKFEYAACPVCGFHYNVKYFKKHLKKIHGISLMEDTSLQSGNKENNSEVAVGETSKNMLVVCPVCKAKVSSRNLNIHLNKVHGTSEYKNRNTREKGSTLNVLPLTAQKQTDVSSEAFYQDLEEKRDGSKGLGHMRREWDGKFGSFPLHDDYSDEADSE